MGKLLLPSRTFQNLGTRTTFLFLSWYFSERPNHPVSNEDNLSLVCRFARFQPRWFTYQLSDQLAVGYFLSDYDIFELDMVRSTR